MGEINISRDEQAALKAIDLDVLDKLIEQCLHEERPDALRVFHLGSCGPYAASRLREYERALAEYGKAKAERKRAETEYCARRAGSDLTHAIQQMKLQVETQERERLLFYVDDQIMPPNRFSERLSVEVGYRWRRTIKDEWVYGSVTFLHDVDSHMHATVSPPKRKLSAAKQERERQDMLFLEWEHLMKLGLHSVRDYFRGGGNGAAIPNSFQAKTDPHNRGLNNYSAQFWLQSADPP